MQPIQNCWLLCHYIAVHIQDQLGSLLLLQQKQVVQQNTIYSQYRHQQNLLPEKVRKSCQKNIRLLSLGKPRKEKKGRTLVVHHRRMQLRKVVLRKNYFLMKNVRMFLPSKTHRRLKLLSNRRLHRRLLRMKEKSAEYQFAY